MTPRQQPRFEQRGRHADVGETFALAIVDGADTVSDFESDIPEKRQESFDVLLPVH
jgi:hypothetical protein